MNTEPYTTDVLDDAIELKGHRHRMIVSRPYDVWIVEVDPGGGPDGKTPPAAALLTDEQAIALANHLLAHTPKDAS